MTTDESGGGLSGTANGMCDQRTYSSIIDISDENNPQVVGTFKPDVNKPENCERNLVEQTNGGMVHYIGFDDRYKMRLVFYAGADQGIRVVDFRDPENPKEIAYYVKDAIAQPQSRTRTLPGLIPIRCSKLFHLHRLEPRWLGHNRTDKSGVQPVHA